MRNGQRLRRDSNSLVWSVLEGHAAANVGDADVVVFSSAVRRTTRSRRGAAARHSGDSEGRDARRADATALLDRCRRLARKDHDHVDDRARARASRAGSDGGDWGPPQRLRQQRAARTARLHGGRSRRERPLVPDVVAVDCRRDQHRRRAHGELWQLRGAAGRVRRVREQGAVLRRVVACADDPNLRAMFPR